jgi:GTP:adenosylcobinamide-phosphate guanylyltransferase
MNVIVPMMGFGTRFSEYDEKKPYVRANTKMMIERVVEPLKKLTDRVYLICPEDEAQKLRKVLPNERVIPMERTRGAAETLRNATDFLGEGPVLAVDCDTVLLNPEKIDPEAGNVVYTFEDEKASGLYSYVRTDGERIVEIREKQPISDRAVSGVYQFKDKEEILLGYELLKEEGEEYTSIMIQELLENGSEWKEVGLDDEFVCLGTPRQLRQNGGGEKKTICFDLDRTLVQDMGTDLRPVMENVLFAQRCKAEGHKVVILTARGMLSTGSKEAAEKRWRPTVEWWLEKNGIKYDELIFGKPFADVYVDDKAVNSFKDLEKETGIYFENGMSAARKMHEVRLTDRGTVVKRGDVAGEAMYYNCREEKILRHLPKAHRATERVLELEFLKGETYSEMVMEMALKESHLQKLAKALASWHETRIELERRAKWYYAEKLQERWEKHRALYHHLRLDEEVEQAVEREYKGFVATVIHGDPVFTNVIDGAEVKLIDMRGRYGTELTLAGEPCYDHAKVMQSLYGYDFYLNGEQVPEDYLKRLRGMYAKAVEQQGERDYLEGVRHKVMSLVLAMLPLHTDNMDRVKRFVKFYEKIKNEGSED